MKNTFSVEFKIFLAAALAMLALATAVVVKQVFEADREEVIFVYNCHDIEEHH